MNILKKFELFRRNFKPKEFAVAKVLLFKSSIPSQVPDGYCYKINIGNIIIYTSSHSHNKLATFCSFFASFLEYCFKKDSFPLKIYYFPDSKLGKKTLIDCTKPLSPKEINSGLNYNNVIVVYRKEEAPKVIIHELIHAYNLDHGVYLDIQNLNIRSSVPIRFTETYTELLASFLFVEYARKADRAIAFNNMFLHFKAQADKIMCVYGTKLSFEQDTHVFEYIIAKSALCQYLDANIEKVDDILYGTKTLFNNALSQAVEIFMKTNECSLRALPKSI